MNNKLNRIINIIKSCTTIQQLDSCKTWVKSIKYIVDEPNEWTCDNMLVKMQLETLITKLQIELNESKYV